MMAVLGIIFILAACVFAGMAAAPLFNRFLPKDKEPTPTSGCAWIFAALACVAIGLWLLFNVPSQEERDQKQWNDAANAILEGTEHGR